jgi:hypothetical protein
LAKGHTYHSQGQSRFAATPLVFQERSMIGQRPYSTFIARLIMAVGQSNNSMDAAPGALPLAMLNMALGQHAGMLLVGIDA